LFDVTQVVAGTMPCAWHRARATGKTWCRSLAEVRRAGGLRTAREGK